MPETAPTSAVVSVSFPRESVWALPLFPTPDTFDPCLLGSVWFFK